jgi:hypothetical protein
MFAGRHSGSRTLEGLLIKARLEKLCAAAEAHSERHFQCAKRQCRTETIQNLAITIVITILSTVTALLIPAAACLAIAASLSTLILVTRPYPQRQAAHLQMSKRYTAVARGCRQSVTRYEENALGDTEMQALVELHLLGLDALKRDDA